MKPCPSPRTRIHFLAAMAGLSLLLASAACASGTQGRSPSRSSNVIGQEEITASSAGNAFDLIQQVRPSWLRGRGSTSLRDPQPVLPVVYLGEINYGTVESLRGFATNGIQELRYIDATTATTRFGSGHGGGVIQVVLRR